MADYAHASLVCTAVFNLHTHLQNAGRSMAGASSPEEVHSIDLVQDALQKQMSRSAASTCKDVRRDNEGAMCLFQLHLAACVQSKGTRCAQLALWVQSTHILSKGHEFA